MVDRKHIKGRGAQINPDNRFTSHLQGDSFDDLQYEADEVIATKVIEIFPKTIINKVVSPDLPMEYSLNPYQGCEHGCIYCYARPTHEYWGYSAGLDFERVLLVKKNAVELLRTHFHKKNLQVMPIMLSGNTDCYQPIEREFALTRSILELCLSYKHPVSIITKNALILRDLDILEELARLNLVAVNISITSLKEELRRFLEPRTASVKRRMEVVRQLSAIGVPVNVMMAPVIPALNDDEFFQIAEQVSQVGAQRMYYQIVRLNGSTETIFRDWVGHNFPDRANKILNQISSLHAGKMSSSTFGERKVGHGAYSENLKMQFKLATKRYGLNEVNFDLRTDLFEIPKSSGDQLSLF